ncbi:MAG: hypothetical protein IK007_01475 [Lachnospiraceae bacterium]|nr:hypothetical protein [Lachnospiraceae bacterium]
MNTNTRYTAVTRLLDERDFVSARTALLAMRQNRDNQWYYYNAVANLGLGYTTTALDLARKAKAMNPKPEYEELIQIIQKKINSADSKSDMIGPPIPKPKFHFFRTLFSTIGGVIADIFWVLVDFFKGILELIGLIGESSNDRRFR